jgi:hypothetical protein
MPTPTYTPLATVTLASATSTVTFSNIPATYRDLILITNEVHASSSTQGSTYLTFNSDNGSNYSMVYMAGNTSGGGQSGTSGTTEKIFTSRFNNVVGNSGIAHIMDYSATDKHKTVISRGNAAQQIGLPAIAFANRWASTAAITTIACTPEISGNYGVGSTFSLYGIVA